MLETEIANANAAVNTIINTVNSADVYLQGVVTSGTNTINTAKNTAVAEIVAQETSSKASVVAQQNLSVTAVAS